MKDQKEKVLWLEIHSPELMTQEASILPEGFVLKRPTTRTDHEEHLRLVEDAKYIIVGGIPLTRDLILAAKKLKLICKWGIGVDLIDMKTAEELNIPVCIPAGSNAIPVAEHVIGLMIAVNKRIPYLDQNMREGNWLKREMRSQCYMLNSKTIGLIGIGNIGKTVTKMLQGFNVNVVYYDIYRLSEEEESNLGVRFVEVDELLKVSDVVSLHMTLNDSTRGWFDWEKFDKMKLNAIFINASRGKIVKEEDLIRALNEKRIRGAGLDVFEVEQPHDADSPLFKMENAVFTPHVADACIDNVLHITQCVYENIYNYSNGIPLDPRNVRLPKY